MGKMGVSAAQAGFGGQQQLFHHQAAFRGGVHAVVDGGEGHLRAGAAVVVFRLCTSASMAW